MNSPATSAHSEGSLARLARWIYNHRKLTVVIWLLILVGSFGLSKALPGEFRADYTTPGSDSKAAGELIAKAFPGNNG